MSIIANHLLNPARCRWAPISRAAAGLAVLKVVLTAKAFNAQQEYNAPRPSGADRTTTSVSDRVGQAEIRGHARRSS
jgi:hypothetical protein